MAPRRAGLCCCDVGRGVGFGAAPRALASAAGRTRSGRSPADAVRGEGVSRPSRGFRESPYGMVASQRYVDGVQPFQHIAKYRESEDEMSGRATSPATRARSRRAPVRWSAKGADAFALLRRRGAVRPRYKKGGAIWPTQRLRHLLHRGDVRVRRQDRLHPERSPSPPNSSTPMLKPRRISSPPGSSFSHPRDASGSQALQLGIIANSCRFPERFHHARLDHPSPVR